MHRYDAGLPMEELCIDIKGPYPETVSGNKYVLVVVDSFSKWMEAYPMANIEAKTVADCLVKQFFSRFGVPYWLKTDQGRQFKSKLFEEMCSLLQVEHKCSTAFHPQGNSRAEKMVQVVGNLLSAFCVNQRHWDENLPLLTLAYRSTVHEVTGYTPNYVMLGREVTLPIDIMMGTIGDEQRLTVSDYIDQLKDRLSSCFDEVRVQLAKYGERQMKYYNLSTRGLNYKPGDLVYSLEKTRKIGVSPKLAPKWLGPHLVVQRLGTVYELQMTPKKSKLLHFDLLKPCHMVDGFPAWLKRARQKLNLTPGDV